MKQGEIYPIPAYDITISSVTNFREIQSSLFELRKAGKKINTQIKPKVKNEICIAKILIYCVDQTTIYGPYHLASEEILSIEVDDRQWGVIVESEKEVFADVWID